MAGAMQKRSLDNKPRKDLYNLFLYVVLYLDSALGGNDTIHGRFCKRVESSVGTTHEIGFQQVAAVSVVLKLALIELERQIRCLEVKRHHLGPSIPKHLEKQYYYF